MYIKIINGVIIFSVIGIAAILIFDFLNPEKPSTSKPIIQQSDQVIVDQSETIAEDPEIACAHPYFNFVKGSSWTYSLSAENTIDSTDSAKLTDLTFTTTITDVQTSSISLETHIKGDDKVMTSTVSCKQSGLYGFPFPIIDIVNEDGDGFSSLLGSTSSSDSLFLPSNLDASSTWNTPISLNLGIPIISEFVQLGINHTVTNIDVDENLLIEGVLDFGDLPIDQLGLKSTNIMNYELQRNLGIIQFNIEAELSSLGKIKAEMKLVEFKEANN